MTQKPCDEWGEQLSKQERDLPFSERAVMKKHLESCPDCAAAYREISTLREQLHTLPAPHFPAGLSPRMAEVMQVSPYEMAEKSPLMLSGSTLDDDLLHAIASDVAGTFPQLVKAYHPQLYQFVLNQVQNPHDAEDIMQDCWTRIFQALCQYSSENIRALPLRVWLFRIVEDRVGIFTGQKNLSDDMSVEELNKWRR